MRLVEGGTILFVWCFTVSFVLLCSERDRRGSYLS